MHWYNPAKRVEEDIPAPISEPQAIELLSWHPHSKEFIDEYRKQRVSSDDVVKALISTRGRFYKEHRRARGS